MLGLSPDVRTLNSSLKSSIKSIPSPNSNSSIIWFDNLRRVLKGRFVKTGRDNWTVLGRTKTNRLIPTITIPGWNFVCDTQSLNQLSIEFLQSENFKPSNFISNIDSISNPLRFANSEKFQFVEDIILPITCGTLEGTVNLLKEILKAIVDDKYLILVVDYDLYWRIQRLFYTNSIFGSYPTLKKSLILIQGPWHIYKNLCESVWEVFSNLILADLWLLTLKKICPASPSLKDIVFFFNLIFIATRGTTWNDNSSNVIFFCLHFLIYTLIPLVHVFFFILSMNFTNIYTLFTLYLNSALILG